MYSGTLPFPPDQIISGNWFDDPFSAQLPVPVMAIIQQNPNLQWVQALVAAVLVGDLQQNCQGGPVSAFAYNLFSNNRYNNEPWMLVMDGGVQFAFGQLRLNQQGDPRQVVSQATVFYATYATAACVERFPELRNWMQPHQVQRCMEVIQRYRAMTGGVGGGGGGHQPQQYASGHVSNIMSPTGGAGAHAFNMLHMEENSKFGNPNRSRAVPLGREPKNEPDQALKNLGVTEVSDIGRSQPQQPVQGEAQPQPAYTPPVNRPRARPVPIGQPTPGAIQPVLEGELQPAGQVHEIPTGQPAPQTYAAPPVAQRVETPQQTLDTSLSVSNDIPALDVLGVSDAEWGEVPEHHKEVPVAQFGNVQPTEQARDTYEVHASGRFMVRPQHLDVVLPQTREEAQLEEVDDLEVIEIASLPTEGDFTVLELEDGNVAVLTTGDDVGRTWSESSPHNYPFNPITHQRYLVQVSDNVRYEAFLPRDPDVDYEDLEFDVAKRAHAKQLRLSDQHILADLSVITEIVPAGAPYTIIHANEELAKAAQDEDQGKQLEAVEKFQGKLTFFDGVTENSNLREELYRLDLFFDQVKARNAVAVSYFSQDTRFVAYGMSTKVNNLMTSQHADRVGKLWLFINDLATACPRGFLFLDKLMTDGVNRLLGKACGITEYDIKSFSEEFYELNTIIEKEYGVLAAEKLQTAANELALGLSISTTGVDLVVKQTFAVVGLPVGLASFDLALTSGEMFVTTSVQAPELNALLDEAKKDQARPKYINTYLSGRDGEVYEVVESLWDDAFKMLVAAK